MSEQLRMDGYEGLSHGGRRPNGPFNGKRPGEVEKAGAVPSAPSYTVPSCVKDWSVATAPGEIEVEDENA